MFIYTDGAARGNPGPAGWGVVVANPDDHTITEYGGRAASATNNQMELQAMVQAAMVVQDHTGGTIYTDSAYIVNNCKHVATWAANGWQTKGKQPVANQAEWEKLLALDIAHLHLVRVPGHAGFPGNERADVIATSFADNDPLLLRVKTQCAKNDPLFHPAEALLSLPSKVTRAKKNRGPAHSYVVLVGNKLSVVKTWAECEALVKGVSGTRFKRANSPAEEEAIKTDFLNG